MQAPIITLTSNDPKITTDLVARLNAQIHNIDFHDQQMVDAYTNALHRCLQIQGADVHITAGNLNQQRTQEILYAMTLGKPIVILDRLAFTQDVTMFAKNAILSRLGKMYLSNISMLDDGDLNVFINNIAQPLNYVVTKHERILIRSQINGYLRNLLAQPA